MSGESDGAVERGISIIQAKVKNVLELIDQLGCLFGPDTSYDTAVLKPEEKQSYLSIVSAVFPLISSANFTHSEIEACVRSEAEKRNEAGPLAKAVRYAVTEGEDQYRAL